MDNSPIPNFITRKTAAERCQCAERSLQRYWSRAIDLHEVAVLEHLKLRTEDGDITEGPQVTKQLIDELKTQGRNPTWFAHAAWVEETYGPRSKPESNATHNVTVEQQRPTTKEPASAVDFEIVSILKEQLRQSQESHQEDKRAFREQIAMLKEMFDTLKEDHSDTKELLKEVHKVFGNVSQAYLSAPRNREGDTGTDKTSRDESPANQPIIEVQPESPQEKGSANVAVNEAAPPSTTAAKQPKPAGRQQSSSARRKKSTSKSEPQGEQPPKWYHMPTFNRLLSRPRK